MKKLSAADLHCVRSAEGWLELGNDAEAQAELDTLPAEQSGHPDVLWLRYRLYQRAGKWDRCYAAAKALTHVEPKSERGWLLLAESLSALGEDRAAYDLLVSRLPDFERHWQFCYATARYAARNERGKAARQLLELAMVYGNPDAVRALALEDADLRNLGSIG